MQTYQGQCHCKKNTYSITAEPEFQFVCYCRDCRVLHSSGHLCGIMFDSSAFQASGTTKTYTYPGGSGKDIITHFCPECSTQLYSFPTNYEGKVVIKVNSLLKGEFNPQQAIFADSAFKWDKPIV